MPDLMQDRSQPLAEDMATRQEQLQQLVAELLDEAKQQGASAAEAAVSSDSGLSVTVRLGEVATIEHSRDQGLGVTVRQYLGSQPGSDPRERARRLQYRPLHQRGSLRRAGGCRTDGTRYP